MHRLHRPSALLLGLAATALASASCDSSSGPPPVGRITVSGALPATGTVAAPVTVRLLVESESGEPIEGVEVALEVASGRGSVVPDTAVSDVDGAVSAAWTLGTGTGVQTLRVAAGGVSEVLSVRAEAGAPAELVLLSPGELVGKAGRALPIPVRVRILDAYANPVPDRRVTFRPRSETDGTAEEANEGLTDDEGVASADWTLGRDVGIQWLDVEVPGVTPVSVRATAEPAANLTVAGFHVTQGVQSLDGFTPLVAGRDGVLRVFALADADNRVRPTVRVRIYRNGSLADTRVLEAGRSSVPLEAEEGSLSATWNLFLPGSALVPGTAILVDVDPDDRVVEPDEEDNVFPASGQPRLLDVRDVPDFRARLIPLEVTVGETRTLGAVSDADRDGYLTAAMAMMPLPGYDVDVREPFSVELAGTGETDQAELLSEVYRLRVAEGSDRYYYGVIGGGLDFPFCGYGYYGLPAAVGGDDCGDWIPAHEWGHNWDRRHAPCGGPADVDLEYPYFEASTGVWGLDVAAGELRDPDTRKDLMSYCEPRWISDYTYEGVLAFRENEAAEGAQPVAAVEPGLILSGRISPRGLVLDPAFRQETRPRLPREDGPYTLRGLAADGGELFRLSFAGARADHARADRRAFAFAVPDRLARTDELERLVLEGPGGAGAVRTRSAALRDRPPRLRARPAGAGRVHITWDDASVPMVVVRNPHTGVILSFARGGRAVIRTDLGRLDLELAGGVGSVRRTVRVR